MAAKKKIICPKCKAKLQIDPDKIISEVVKFKCPGCSSVLRVKKPILTKEPSLSSPARQSGLKTESNIEQPRPESLGPGIESEIEKDLREVGQADKGKVVEPAISEKIEEDISAASKSLSEEKDGPLIPEGKIVPLKPPGESLLEEYDHENLREYEEGEAEAGDLEWTRYADKKGPILPENSIDLNVIPASDSGLQDTLADLQQAETYNLQGEYNLDKNLVKQAVRDFNHALEINPDYVDALVNRGGANVLQNKYNDALKDLNHALDLEKKHAEIYNLRGEIYLLSKMFDQATKDFTAAIILNPMYSDAYLNRARAYAEKGMKEEAELDYNQAIKAAPDKFSGFMDLDSSESLFDEDNSSSKEKAAKYIQQGLEDLKAEKYYEAIESFTQAINLSPDDARGYINRGQAYVELDQPDEAIVDLNRAVIYDPLNPTLYYWRAMAWKALDSRINTVADLKLSCELGYEPACNEYQMLKPKKH
jgi:tetratricopeptide (TPR) repeat protein